MKRWICCLMALCLCLGAVALADTELTVNVKSEILRAEVTQDETTADATAVSSNQQSNRYGIKEQADTIFRHLVYINETTLKYLEELKRAWELLYSNYPSSWDTSKTISPTWYWYTYFTDMDHSVDFTWCFMEYNIYFVDDSYAIDRVVFRPLLEYFNGDLLTTVSVIAYLIYGNDHLSEYIDSVKEELRIFMADNPDSAYLSQLQEFYQNTYMMVETALHPNYTYSTLTNTINDYKVEQVRAKAAFSLEFLWRAVSDPNWANRSTYDPALQEVFNAAKSK